METSLGSSALNIQTPVFNSLNLVSLGNPSWLWFLFGFFVFIAALFFITVLYHWLRYETSTSWSSLVIATNGLVIMALLGGAGINLTQFLANLTLNTI